MHRDYHGLLEMGAPEPLRRQLDSPSILQAVIDGDVQAATARLARHLAGTAVRVLASSAPDYITAAVPRAVALITGDDPA